eukprot:16449999-Heterocapsa_arctica.AAC.2
MEQDTLAGPEGSPYITAAVALGMVEGVGRTETTLKTDQDTWAADRIMGTRIFGSNHRRLAMARRAASYPDGWLSEGWFQEDRGQEGSPTQVDGKGDQECTGSALQKDFNPNTGLRIGEAANPVPPARVQGCKPEGLLYQEVEEQQQPEGSPASQAAFAQAQVVDNGTQHHEGSPSTLAAVAQAEAEGTKRTESNAQIGTDEPEAQNTVSASNGQAHQEPRSEDHTGSEPTGLTTGESATR